MENLNQTIAKALERFPKLFDNQLIRGFHKLIGCTHTQFIEERSEKHLKKILLAQYYLQKQIEKALLKEGEQAEREIFLHVFSEFSCLCVAIVLSYQRQSEIFNEENILSAAQTFIPGIKEIPRSFYTWQSSEKSYLFCYVELQKLRGKDLFSHQELKKNLKKHIYHSVTSCSPPVFWPYNHEESYKQILSLQKELHNHQDLPQVSIHFRGQTASELEFLICMVRPKSDLDFEERFAPFIRSLFHFKKTDLRSRFPAQGESFSLFLSSRYFSQKQQAINLLKVRRYITTLLKEVIGPFRDFNGGLLEKQHTHFQEIKRKLEKKIPNFSLFGETLFFAIHPLEKQFSLSEKDVELLFTTFSSALRDKKTFCLKKSRKNILIIKSANLPHLFPYTQLVQDLRDKIAFAELQIARSHYLCIVDITGKYLPLFFQQPTVQSEELPTLRFTFQAGSPPSLHPHYVSPDMRSCILSKLLYEGLTRLDRHHKPQLAGADKYFTSKDQLTYTFMIRPSYWSNGEPVTAWHYEQSWKQAFNTRFSEFYNLKNGRKIKNGLCRLNDLGVCAIDQTTLQIHLEYPDPFFLEKLTHPLFFPCLEVLEEPAHFNGPYLVQQNQTNCLNLETNPYFWDRAHIYFKRIQIQWTDCSQTILSLFKKKQTDWLGEPVNWSLFTARSKAIPPLKHKPVSRHFLVYLNTRHPALSSRYIRQALSLSIDRSYICQHILTNDKPLTTPIPKPIHIQGSTRYENSISFVQELFRKGMEELRIQFPPLTISFCFLPKRKELAEYLKVTWEKVFNIQVELKGMSWNKFYYELERGEFDIGGITETPFSNDLIALLDKFSYAETNLSQWSHTTYHETMVGYHTTNCSTQKTKLLEKAQQILVEHTPFIPISVRTYQYTHHPHLEGYILDNQGHLDLRWAYLKKDSHEK